ncbi:MAG: WYL domain-containing protein [Pseudanabaenales cyanobacterium]|nr:WYL domain-containing protein [Pseudanabaenales cyanobacterium]
MDCTWGTGLSKTDDPKFPNCLKVCLPKWTLTHDVDFKRWILGFGGHVKVITPQFLADDIQRRDQEI